MEIIFKTPFNLLRYLSDNEKSRNLVDAVLVITFHFLQSWNSSHTGIFTVTSESRGVFSTNIFDLAVALSVK